MLFKRIALIVACVLCMGIFTGCSAGKYKNGTYTATGKEFSNGWKEIVEVTIEDGTVHKISWDAFYVDDSIPVKKKQYSKSGLYGMMVAGAQSEWCDQVKAAEDLALEKGIDAITYKDDDYADAITCCTIHVSGFVELVNECLKKAEK